MSKLKIHQIAATGTRDDTTFLRGDGTWNPPPLDGDGGAEATRDHRLGLNLTKQGIVLAKGAGGTWDADLVESPSVMDDPKSGKLAMVYVGYGSTTGATRAGVGLAYSTDGVTWTKQGSAAILPHSGTSGAPDENGASGPVLFWDNDNGQYVLYYIGLTTTGYEGGTKSICYATATSLTGPWTRHGAVITTSGSGWRANAVWHVSIVERDGTWYCFFNASNTGNVEQIGYATAPSLTGPWTVDDTNSPLISPTTGWEDDNVGDPSVRRVGDTWVVYYYGYDASPASASDGIAVCPDSAFPLGPWVKYSGNPVLAPGASYDAKFAHKPFVIYKGGVLYHYYTAVAADDTRQIALATEGLPAAAGIPATLLDAKGDLIVATANDTAARLPVGSNDQVLTADSAQSTGTKWATPKTVATDIVWDTKGDLAVATGADAASKLPVGSNGQVLTADSAQSTGVKWATPSSSPTTALVPLVSQIGSGDPDLVWTDSGELLMVEVPL